MNLIEVKPNRFYYLIPLPFLLLLGLVFFRFGFISAEPFHADTFAGPEEISTGMVILSSLVLAVSLFLFLHWTYRFIFNPAVFTANEQGFTTNLAGIKTELIHWHDVAGIKEINNSGSDGQDQYSLAVYFKSPNAYLMKQGFLIRLIQDLALKAGYYRNLSNKPASRESDVPMLLPVKSLGKKYVEVKRLFEEKTSII